MERRSLTGQLVPYPPSFRSKTGKLTAIAFSAVVVAATIRMLRPTVIHAENHQAAVAALAATKMAPAKVVFDAHSVRPEEAILEGQTLGYADSRIARDVNLARAWERRAWSRADAVIVVSKSLADHFIATYGPRSGPVVRVPCATTEGSFSSPGSRERVRALFGIEDREVILYVGSLAPYQQAPDMLRLFAALRKRRPSAFFLIISQSPKERWETLARENGIPNSAYRIASGRADEVPDLTAAGDVGLMLRRDIVVNRVAFPTKLAEYLAAGVPVLATTGAQDPASFILEHEVGRVAGSFEAADAMELERFLSDVSGARSEWSARCRSAVESHLLWPRYSKTIVELYDAIRENSVIRSNISKLIAR
jgi:glycosyltransferase involved in cell wall biosynthesis